MACRQFAEFLMDYLDGALDESERRCFEEHLAECPDCVAYLATYRQTIRFGKKAFVTAETAISEEIPEELVAAVLASRRH